MGQSEHQGPLANQSQGLQDGAASRALHQAWGPPVTCPCQKAHGLGDLRLGLMFLSFLSLGHRAGIFSDGRLWVLGRRREEGSLRDLGSGFPPISHAVNPSLTSQSPGKVQGRWGSITTSAQIPPSVFFSYLPCESGRDKLALSAYCPSLYLIGTGPC